METATTLREIRQALSEGALESGLTRLVAFLDAQPQYSELAQVVRVNQADFFQLKSQQLRNTISNEEARMVSNRITSNVLEVIQRIEAGKNTLQDAATSESASERRLHLLRYAIAGGIITLTIALLAWRFYGGIKQDEGCPKYDSAAQMRVMILPFTKSEDVKKAPEKEIAGTLDRLINKIAALRGRTGVDINTDPALSEKFISRATALQKARDCGVEMVVWGKISDEGSPDTYTLDVQYQIMSPNGVASFGDTSLSRLVRVEENGRWRQDVETVARLLCLVLLNQNNVRAPAFLLDSLGQRNVIAAVISDAGTIDTSTHFALAYQAARNKQWEKAIEHYNLILAAYPTNQSALLKRGSMYYEKQEYAAAAQDLEAISDNNAKALPELQRTRIDALLKSGQFDKARQKMEQFDAVKPQDKEWKKRQETAVHDSIKVTEVRRQRAEQLATSTKNVKAEAQAARYNLALGNTKVADQFINKALKKAPNDPEVNRLAGAIALQQGDTLKAAPHYEKAARIWSAKGIQKNIPPVVQQLLIERADTTIRARPPHWSTQINFHYLSWLFHKNTHTSLGGSTIMDT